MRRVGHGGTLDPFAGGVLPVFVGRATRLVEYHMADDKAYRAMVAFGASSTTDDLDGELTPGEGPAPDRAAVEAALARFRGRISQVPPDHSAVRVQGRHAYEVARGGERPVLAARDVEVRTLDLVDWDATDPSRPTATLEIACSAGTYIRAIARDLGAALGCGAYLVALTRSRSGPFTHDQAHAPDAIRAAFATDHGAELLLPADAGLDAFPIMTIDGGDLQALLRGQVVRAPVAGATNGVGHAVDHPGGENGHGGHDGSHRSGRSRRPAQDRLLPGARRARSPGRHRAPGGWSAASREGPSRAGTPRLGMERHSSLEALPEGLRMVAAIGVFDGVHRGHRAFIGRLVDGSASERCAIRPGDLPAASCERPSGHAAERPVRPARAGGSPGRAGRRSSRRRALRRRPCRHSPPRTSWPDCAAGRRLVALVMTAASAFGRGRAGNLASMQALGAREGFDVVEVGQRDSQGAVISSSRIRAAVEAGRLAEAARLLGRRYAVTGTVVHGDARGRTLGFPTANLAFEAPVALPPDGIYAVRVSWGGDPLRPDRRADGVASLGVRPTFGHGSRILEVFLLDFDEDLYGVRLRVEFVRRQRGERRFTSVEGLVDQMGRDVGRARAVLAAARS